MRAGEGVSGKSERKRISVVIPVFNEAGNILKVIERLTCVFEGIQHDFELIFVDDGSSDTTASVLKDLHNLNPYIHYIELSKNFGHQNALKAGIDAADGDCVISMDGDLQHPPELLPQLIARWEDGYDIVYTRRKCSEKNSLYKNATSNMFYKLVNKMSEVKLEQGTADFRLIDRKVANVLLQFNEIDPFIRGIIKWVGFSQYAIDYIPEARFAGKSKYSLKKMLKLALQGITSFSIRPLYTAVVMGFCFAGLSLLYLPYVLYSIYSGHAISGWASIIMTIVFFGGLQIMIMGIIGIYVGKIFLQTKLRPNYIVKDTSLSAKQHDLIKF